MSELTIRQGLVRKSLLLNLWKFINVNSIAIDNHVCVPFDADPELVFKQLAIHKDAGFSAVGVNIGYGDMSWGSHIDCAERLTHWIKQKHEDYYLVRSARDLIANADDRRLGIFFNVEGASLLQGDSSRVSILSRLGVKWMCLTYNQSNDLAGGCMPGAVDRGLTALGREVVETMNEQGIVVCGSHTGHRSARDIIQAVDFFTLECGGHIPSLAKYRQHAYQAVC